MFEVRAVAFRGLSCKAFSRRLANAAERGIQVVLLAEGAHPPTEGLQCNLQRLHTLCEDIYEYSQLDAWHDYATL